MAVGAKLGVSARNQAAAAGRNRQKQLDVSVEQMLLQKRKTGRNVDNGAQGPLGS